MLPRMGKIKAYNYGVSRALGDYIKIWSSDDLLFKDATDILIENIRGYDIVAHNCSVANEQLRVIQDKFIDLTPYTASDVSIQDVIKGLTYPSGCYLMTKNCVEQIFPLPEEAPFEDRYIFMMIIYRNYSIKYLDQSLAVYRQTAGSAYGGVYNFNKKIFLYRVERDLKMVQLFHKILPPEYHYETNRRIEELGLLQAGSAGTIWASNAKFIKKLHIIFIKYFYGLYRCILFLKKRVFYHKKLNTADNTSSKGDIK